MDINFLASCKLLAETWSCDSVVLRFDPPTPYLRHPSESAGTIKIRYKNTKVAPLERRPTLFKFSKNDLPKTPAPPSPASPPKPPKPPKTDPPVPKPPKPKKPAPAHWEGLKTWAEAHQFDGETLVQALLLRQTDALFDAADEFVEQNRGERWDGDQFVEALIRAETEALYQATAELVDELKGAQATPALTAVNKRTNFRQAIYDRMTRTRRAKR